MGEERTVLVEDEKETLQIPQLALLLICTTVTLLLEKSSWPFRRNADDRA